MKNVKYAKRKTYGYQMVTRAQGLGVGCRPKSNTPPQTNTSPSSFAKCLTFGEGKAFVRASATMSFVGQ